MNLCLQPHPMGWLHNFLREMIHEHLLPVWPQQIALNSDILIAYLFSQINDLEQAMSPEGVMKILTQYFH